MFKTNRIYRMPDAAAGGAGSTAPKPDAATKEQKPQQDNQNLLLQIENLKKQNADLGSNNKDLLKSLKAITAQNDQLTEQNEGLKTQVGELTAAKEEADKNESAILTKMAVGLTRDQATAVIKRQADYDAKRKTEQPDRDKARAARQKANKLA